MTNEQRDCEAALARLQRALEGEPKPPQGGSFFDDLMRKFGMSVDDKEVRNDRK